MKLFKARFLGAGRLRVLKGGEHSESQKISALSGTEWNLASAWLSRMCLEEKAEDRLEPDWSASWGLDRWLLEVAKIKLSVCSWAFQERHVIVALHRNREPSKDVAGHPMPVNSATSTHQSLQSASIFFWIFYFEAARAAQELLD